ncbi:hypothetical protein O181_089707 [Austropuccinia psidii MF-1]|uniref:Uncharacterized protein n=1 Tax=Austropuccinia psidii MF-1 TaxID=1389203 RepID=A0A9Q3IU35_9BASI|nr:hypothetical protein [Austropuccinia psidii MF-1]
MGQGSSLAWDEFCTTGLSSTNIIMPTLMHELTSACPLIISSSFQFLCTGADMLTPSSPILVLFQTDLIIFTYYNAYAPGFLSRCPSTPRTASLPSPILTLPRPA